MTDAELVWGLFAAGCVAAVWYDNLNARELALAAIRRACRELSVQLLDETVVVSKLSLRRGARGWIQVHRAFRFDVSLNGVDRFSGHALVVGNRVVSLYVPSQSGGTIIDAEMSERQIGNDER